MKLTEKLTQFQEIALRGEIAYALSTAAHDADMKYRVFMILREIDEKCRPLIVEAVKETSTLDEEIFDRIYLEVLNGEIPVWLWIEKTIADIKESLLLGNLQTNGSYLHVNRKEARLKLIESAFTLFVRKAIMISYKAGKQLLNEILECNDLDFLHTVCFALIPACDEIEEQKGEERETSEKLLDCLFDIRDIMSYKVETKALKSLNKADREIKKNFTEEPPKSNLTLKTEGLPMSSVVVDHGQVGTITTTSSSFSEDISQFISKQIKELFGDSVGIQGLPVEIRVTEVKQSFVVRKIFKASGIFSDLKEFETEEEALSFKQQLEKEFPELLNSCEFKIITKERN